MQMTFRTCSNCASWRYPATAPDEEIVSATCLIHDKRKRGGDKCSKWTPRVEEKALDPWDYLG